MPCFPTETLLPPTSLSPTLVSFFMCEPLSKIRVGYVDIGSRLFMEELMYTLQLKEESENTEVIVKGNSQHRKSSS